MRFPGPLIMAIKSWSIFITPNGGEKRGGGEGDEWEGVFWVRHGYVRSFTDLTPTPPVFPPTPRIENVSRG